MMNIAENSKQLEYLMKIRDVGMQIVFRRADCLMVLNEFISFTDYIDDEIKRMDYIKSLEKVYQKISEKTLTPDELLFELGQYTPFIIYEDEEEDEEQTSLYADDSWLYR